MKFQMKNTSKLLELAAKTYCTIKFILAILSFQNAYIWYPCYPQGAFRQLKFNHDRLLISQNKTIALLSLSHLPTGYFIFLP